MQPNASFNIQNENNVVYSIEFTNQVKPLENKTIILVRLSSSTDKISVSASKKIVEIGIYYDVSFTNQYFGFYVNLLQEFLLDKKINNKQVFKIKLQFEIDTQSQIMEKMDIGGIIFARIVYNHFISSNRTYVF